MRKVMVFRVMLLDTNDFPARRSALLLLDAPIKIYRLTATKIPVFVYYVQPKNKN